MNDPNPSALDIASIPEQNLQCPVGQGTCTVINETLTLRAEVLRLEAETHADALTGLYNFRHFSQTLEREMERTRRTEQSTVLIMLDLDHFKQVNDNWGHEVGNRALVMTAKVLKNSVRRLDIACRYGGEEFAVILPATELLVGLQVAERIRAQVEAMSILVDGEDIALTASLGVDIYRYKQDDTPQQLVARTDQYLYEAKQTGRNKVCNSTFEEEKPPTSVSVEERGLLADFFGEDSAGD